MEGPGLLNCCRSPNDAGGGAEMSAGTKLSGREHPCRPTVI